MEAGPRDNEETAVDGLRGTGGHLGAQHRRAERGGVAEDVGALRETGRHDLPGRDLGSGTVAHRDADRDGGPVDRSDRADDVSGTGAEAEDGVGEDDRHGVVDAVDDVGHDGDHGDDADDGDEDGGDADPETAEASGADTPVEPQELRPPRKIRLWQLAPIVILGALGSLMFAFPLAFEPGGGSGAVVAMLGLLICGCAAGWGLVAARRVGQRLPGLPATASGQRSDWRVVLLYAVVVGTVVALAIWRVARLR